MAKSTQTIVLKFNATGGKKVEATVQQVNGSLNVLGRRLKTVGVKTTETSRGTASFTKRLTSVEKTARRVGNTFTNMGNVFRLSAQGMMSIGKSMSIFLTPAILLSLKGAYNAAVDFNDALVRVSKTTQLTGSPLKKLSDGLRDMATRTSTSTTDLAKMAEQVGQLGVRSVPSILELVKTFNMLTIATDIAAKDVAISMGKIANAFGIDLNTEKGVEDIEKLSSVINRLENELAAAAPEILQGLANFSQVASLINVPPRTGAALVAALVSVGFSAEEAGTALRNMTVKMTQNADQIAQLMKNTRGYGDAQSVLTAINEDAGRVLTDLIDAAASGNDTARTLVATMESAGIRGGKAWAALAGGVATFHKALAISDDEWERATSLINEYQTALLSTKNQMGVLKNNINEVALTFGDALLPVINQLVQTLVPAIRWAAKAFKELSPTVKKNIVLILLFVAALGPVIMFLSLFAFGISMVMISMSKSIGLFIDIIVLLGKLGGSFVTIGKFVVGLASSWNLAVAAIVAGIVYLLLKFTGLGAKIADFFISLGSKAEAWGKNLIATYGQGMLAGAVSVLAKVLTAIGNFIGRFFAGHSPPDVGPLSHIDEWGKNVFDAYLEGFANADFGILSDVGSKVEKILETFAKVGNIGKKQKVVAAMQMRQDLAKLINIFNDTGQIAQDVLDDITANLGEAKDEVQKLIRLWLEYIRIQKELKDLQERRKSLLNSYRQEIQLIAQSNMTAEEKADAIRKAMKERHDGLRSLKQEEDALNEQKDAAQEQLDTQKAMIQAMQKQDDLQASLIDSLDKLGGKLSSLEDFSFPPLEFDTSQADENLATTYQNILTLEERIQRMSGIWSNFIAGFTGKPPIDIDQFLKDTLGEEDYSLAKRLGLEEVDPELAGIVDRMERAYNIGQDIGNTWEGLKATFDNIKTKIENIKTAISGLFSGGKNKGKGKSGKDILASLMPKGTFAKIEAFYNRVVGVPLEIMGEFTARIKEQWDELWSKLQENPDVAALFDNIGASLDWLSTHWSDIWGVILQVFFGIFQVITGILLSGINVILAFVGTILEGINSLINIVTIFKIIKQRVIEIVITWLANMIANFGPWIVNTVAAIKKWGSRVLSQFVTGIVLLYLRAVFWWARIRAGIFDKMRAIAIDIAIQLLKWKIKFDNAVKGFKTAAKNIIQGVIDGFNEKKQGVINAVQGIYDAALAIWKAIWKLHSPSKIMMESGQLIIQGAIEGIDSMKGDFEASFSGVTDGLIGSNIQSPVSTLSPVGVSNVGAAAQVPNITMQFGKDSVRSDRDIEDIEAAVERVLAHKIEGNISAGMAFGEEI